MSTRDPYYAANSITYQARGLALPNGFYSGFPPVEAKRNLAAILGSQVFDRSWLHNVHLPVLTHLLVPSVPHALTLARDSTGQAPLHATHIDDQPLHHGQAPTGPLTEAATLLDGFQVTITHAAAAALYTHCNRHALRTVPPEVQVPALAAGLSPDEIRTAHADGTLTPGRARFMFVLTEPLPGA